MAIASGLFKIVSYKKEGSFGTPPPASGAQALRRTSADLSLAKDTYKSNEIRPEMQIADFRHGVRRVSGKIQGDLSAKTWADFFGSFCKRAFTAAPSITGASITIAGTGPYTVTRAAGSFLTDNYKVGHVVRLTAGGFNAANINKNLFITAITATTLTVITLNGSALVVEATPVTGATLSAVGKQTFIPTSGQIEDSYTIEQFYADLPSSESFIGCKVNGFTVNLPPSGIATVDFDLLGKDMVASASQYFTSPTPATTTTSMAAVNGLLRVNGQVVAVLTGLSITGAANYSGDPVVGSNAVPQFFPGMIEVKGQATAYFDSTTLRDVFVNETEIDIIGVFTADNSAAADFVVFAMPRVKIGGHTKSDGDGAIIATLPFEALLNVAGGAGTATEKTTLLIQDSAA